MNTISQLLGHENKFSELKHVNNKRQLIELIAGFVLMLALGVGSLLLVIWVIDFEFCSTYLIKNRNTKEVISVSRSTWKNLHKK